jgi:hypothetical protein
MGFCRKSERTQPDNAPRLAPTNLHRKKRDADRGSEVTARPPVMAMRTRGLNIARILPGRVFRQTLAKLPRSITAAGFGRA